jgi:hypothetical protein
MVIVGVLSWLSYYFELTIGSPEFGALSSGNDNAISSVWIISLLFTLNAYLLVRFALNMNFHWRSAEAGKDGVLERAEVLGDAARALDDKIVRFESSPDARERDRK